MANTIPAQVIKVNTNNDESCSQYEPLIQYDEIALTSVVVFEKT